MVSEHIPENFEDFSKLGLVKDGIYKRTEFAIENVFDICAIISSDLMMEMPENEEDIIENLADKKYSEQRNDRKTEEDGRVQKHNGPQIWQGR